MKPGLLGGALSKVIPIGKSAGKSVNLVTLRADSPGWHHPGFQAKRIHVQVQTEVAEKLVPKLFSEAFGRVTI